MSSSPIGRLRFFFYSGAITWLEAIALRLWIVKFVELDGTGVPLLVPTGPKMAGASLIVHLAFFAVRVNLASRRCKDANLNRWVLWIYVALMLFSLFLLAGLLLFQLPLLTIIVVLAPLSLVLMVIWSVICFAKPKARSFDPAAFLQNEGRVPGPWDIERPPAATPEPEAHRWPTPPVNQPQGLRAPAVGKRGLT